MTQRQLIREIKDLTIRLRRQFDQENWRKLWILIDQLKVPQRKNEE